MCPYVKTSYVFLYVKKIYKKATSFTNVAFFMPKFNLSKKNDPLSIKLFLRNN
jgi:hypothetical protein